VTINVNAVISWPLVLRTAIMRWHNRRLAFTDMMQLAWEAVLTGWVCALPEFCTVPGRNFKPDRRHSTTEYPCIQSLTDTCEIMWLMMPFVPTQCVLGWLGQAADQQSSSDLLLHALATRQLPRAFRLH
jgi:hypothetical protein